MVRGSAGFFWGTLVGAPRPWLANANEKLGVKKFPSKWEGGMQKAIEKRIGESKGKRSSISY